MTETPRKATDVLLEIEAKIDSLIKRLDASDLNIKVVSNKLGEVMRTLDKLQAPSLQKATIEAIQQPISNQAAVIFGQVPTQDLARSIPVTAESKLSVDETPQGFRRSSRPETYAGDNDYLKKEGVPPPTNPSFFVAANSGNHPPPGRSVGETLPFTQPAKKTATPSQSSKSAPLTVSETEIHGIIPIEQRVVDRNGKAIFLADVEIVDSVTGEQVSKSRTNGTGKWMAALSIGQYKVTIKKLESVTRERSEAIQTITVDGTQSPLKLPVVIIK